jgi:sulfate adenylyltransferase subunit 2
MAVNELFGLDSLQVWNTELAFQQLSKLGQAETKRTAERRLHEMNMLPAELKAVDVRDELGREPILAVLESELTEARDRRSLVLFVQLHDLPNGVACMHANDARGGRYWIPLAEPDQKSIELALGLLQTYLNKPVAIVPHGELTAWCRSHTGMPGITFCQLGYPPVLDLSNQESPDSTRHAAAIHLASWKLKAYIFCVKPSLKRKSRSCCIQWAKTAQSCCIWRERHFILLNRLFLCCMWILAGNSAKCICSAIIWWR